jgi:RecB family endonuclease NucS
MLLTVKCYVNLIIKLKGISKNHYTSGIEPNHSMRTTHIVELKRTAMLGAVDQCVRYLAAYSEDIQPKYEDYHVHVTLAAYDIRPNTLRQAERNHVNCIVLDSPV